MALIMEYVIQIFAIVLLDGMFSRSLIFMTLVNLAKFSKWRLLC